MGTPKCMIHAGTEDLTSNLVSPRDTESWTTLLKAAKLKGHKVLLDICDNLPEGSLPKVYYHRKCRQLFTMKRELAKHEIKDEVTVKCFRKSAREKDKKPTVILDKTCLFCQGFNKYLKSSNSREPLTQCLELQADKTIRKAVQDKEDGRLLPLVTSTDLVAAEAWYHKSCYKKYTKGTGKAKECTTTETSENQEDKAYKEAEEIALDTLFHYIRTDLLDSPRVILLTDMTDVVLQKMTELGISQIRQSTRKHIKRKLQREFESALQFTTSDKGKVLVFPDKLSRDVLVRENHNLTEELEITRLSSENSESLLIKAANVLRTTIKKCQSSKIWPFIPSKIKDMFKIPSPVKTFFCSVITGDSSPISMSQRSEWLIDSFSQDMMYAVSRGALTPPKHILLPNAVKSLTGNVEIIRALNRLGHGISYTTMEENETELALSKLSDESQMNGLPETMKPHVFTTLSWDNIDRLEETLTGAGTTHRVNGISVQPLVFGPDLLTSQATKPKSGRRSIDIPEQQLPIYNAGKRQGPIVLHGEDNQREEHSKEALDKTLIWMISRLGDPSNQVVTGWTGFNIMTRNEISIVPDKIAYLPTINAPATDLSTVNEILARSLVIQDHLNLQKIVIVFDQALYAKATEIVWKNKQKFQHVILRMGTFHTIMNFLAILGKRFQDAGLRDILIEAGTLAQGSVSTTMDGRHYNRGVRVHKHMMEALLRLAWKGFLPWLNATYPERITTTNTGLDALNHLRENIDQRSFSATMKDSSVIKLLENFNMYLSFLREGNGELSGFWMTYVDMVAGVMLGLIRATREGDWELHMSAIRKMIPWCFAYDRINYARYLTAYFSEMSLLPSMHPDVYNQFKEGRFAVQLGDKNTFGRIPVDQTIEETVNKDTQTAGGTCRFSTKSAPVNRFYLTAEHRSEYMHLFRSILGLTARTFTHAELQNTRIQKDEKAVSKLESVIEEMVNPFDVQQDFGLVNIASATLAPSDVRKDLMKAQQSGEAAYEDFKKERLSEANSSKFFDKLSRQNLKTFSSICKMKKLKTNGREVMLKTTSNIFGTMLMMAQTRKLDMRKVLQYPLGPFPWSLATSDGMPRKTTKASLAKELQKNIPAVEEIPNDQQACIIDGMALVQKMKGDGKTFGQLASAILSVALCEARTAERIDIVFDVYNQISIKNVERQLRGMTSGETVQYKGISSKQTITQWRHFLLKTANKTELIKFLAKEWQQPQYKDIIGQRLLYVTSGEEVFMISKDGSTTADDLQSSQEEADTRLLLHSAHAADQGFKTILMVSDDTDVFVMCLMFSWKIKAKIFMKVGSRLRVQYINIHMISASLGQSVCEALPGLHAFTGCDSVSAFAGQGKLSALKLMKSDPHWQGIFKLLGSEMQTSQIVQSQLETFTCLLYSAKTSTSKVSKLRYDMFASRKGKIEPHQLPPCADALQKHIQRANYQSAIWKNSLVHMPEIPSPTSHGWKLESGNLVYDWMDGSPAPESVLELISCPCRKECTLPQCICLVNKLKCSQLCRLTDCSNQPDEDEEESYSSSGEDSETDDEFA